MIYFDNAATTFPKPECVYKTVEEVQRNFAFNSGRGTYKSARKANQLVEGTREKIAALLKCSSQNVVFSPSATIAMNQVLCGLELNGKTIYVSPFEHNAVVRVLHSIAKRSNIKIEVIPFDPITQALNEGKMKNQFAINHPDVVVVNHISNVTGLILPVEKIFDAAKNYNAVTVLDSSQSAGLLDIDLRHLKCDFLVFAGHKSLYGPIGVGGFVINNTDVQLNSVLCGGTGSDSLNPEMPLTIPDKYEPASHDIVSIAALNSALEWISNTGVCNIYKHKKELTDYAVTKLRTVKDISLYLPENLQNHISVISITHKEYKPFELAEILDEDFDIAVRSGYHCAPYVHDLIGTKESEGTVRISIGYFNDKSQIDALVNALIELE